MSKKKTIYSGKRGFTLVETIMAIGLLGFIVLGVVFVMDQINTKITSSRRSEELNMAMMQFKEWVENPLLCRQLIKPLVDQQWEPSYRKIEKLKSVNVDGKTWPVGYVSPLKTYEIMDYTIMSQSDPISTQEYMNIEFIVTFEAIEEGKKKKLDRLYFLPVRLNPLKKIVDCYDYKKLVFNEVRHDLCESVYGGEFDEEINDHCNIITSEDLVNATCIAFGRMPVKGKCGK